MPGLRHVRRSNAEMMAATRRVMVHEGTKLSWRRPSQVTQARRCWRLREPLEACHGGQMLGYRLQCQGLVGRLTAWRGRLSLRSAPLKRILLRATIRRGPRQLSVRYICVTMGHKQYRRDGPWYKSDGVSQRSPSAQPFIGCTDL